MAYRVLVTGDRNWACSRLATVVVVRLWARHPDGLLIVHGGASGVDHAFEQVARMAGVPTEVHPASWEVHGRRAGPIRNQAMVDGGADVCLAFHRDLRRSRGTRDCVRRALEAGIPCWLVESDAEDARPGRITQAYFRPPRRGPGEEG